MAAPVKVTWPGLGPEDLRVRARREGDPSVVRRLLAIALVLEGSSREAAASAGGMDRQTLRDWVHRYNDRGPAGLSDGKHTGRRALLTPEQRVQVAAWVKAGPDLAVDGVVRWRRADLAAKVSTEFGVTLAERTVGELLRRLGFRRLSARPQHPRQGLSGIPCSAGRFEIRRSLPL